MFNEKYIYHWNVNDIRLSSTLSANIHWNINIYRCVQQWSGNTNTEVKQIGATGSTWTGDHSRVRRGCCMYTCMYTVQYSIAATNVKSQKRRNGASITVLVYAFRAKIKYLLPFWNYYSTLHTVLCYIKFWLCYGRKLSTVRPLCSSR